MRYISSKPSLVFSGIWIRLVLKTASGMRGGLLVVTSIKLYLRQIYVRMLTDDLLRPEYLLVVLPVLPLLQRDGERPVVPIITHVEGQGPESGGQGQHDDVIPRSRILLNVVREEGEQVRLLLPQVYQDGRVDHGDLVTANFLPVEYLLVLISSLVVESLRHPRPEVAVESNAGQHRGDDHEVLVDET